MRLPEQVRDLPLVRVRRESKRPVRSVEAVESVESVEEWVEAGGNVGVVARSADDLVVVDLDRDDLAWPAVRHLPTPTFTVRTGGGGSHLYYRSEWSENRTFTVDGEEWGSVRASGWFCVCPPSAHPEGGRYEVLVDAPVVEAPVRSLRAFVAAVEEVLADADDGPPDGRGGAAGDRAGRGPVGGDDLDELDELIDHDERRREVRLVLRDRSAGHRRRVWVAGFLLKVVGLTEGEVVGLIDRYNRWENYDREVTREQVESVARSAGGGR